MSVALAINKYFENDNVDEFKKLFEISDLKPDSIVFGDIKSTFDPLFSDDPEFSDDDIITYNFSYENDITLLTYACAFGKINIAKYIINLNILTSSVNEFHIACYHGHLNIVKLLENKVDNYEKPEAIYLTVKGGSLDVLKYLVDNYFLTDKEIVNYLVISIENLNYEMIKYLLLHYKGKHLKSNLLISPISNNHLKIVKLLYLFLDHTEDERLLIKAIQANSIDIVKFFLDIGIKYKTNDYSALYYAAFYEHLDILNLLIKCTEETIEYEKWSSRQAISTIKKCIKLNNSLYKGPFTEDHDCGLCYEPMKIKQGIIQCDICKKFIHLECQQKWNKSCIYCRTIM